MIRTTFTNRWWGPRFLEFHAGTHDQGGFTIGFCLGSLAGVQQKRSFTQYKALAFGWGYATDCPIRLLPVYQIRPGFRTRHLSWLGFFIEYGIPVLDQPKGS